MDDVICIDKSVYFENIQTLVFSDLHLGVTSQDSIFPVPEYNEIQNRFKDIVGSVESETVIFNGDVFGHYPIPKEAKNCLKDMLECVDNDAKIIFTLGNHEDKNNGYPKFVRRTFKVDAHFSKGDYLFHHGHKTPPRKSKIQVIGHCHPIDNNGKPCLVYGNSSYYSSDVFITPAFSNIVNGRDFYRSSYKGFCPILSDGEALDKYVIMHSYNSQG